MGLKMGDLDNLSNNLQESEFRTQGEAYFDREFSDLLKELDCNQVEFFNLKSTVVNKYVEMRKSGFSEYISLSELENLSTNTKVNEINEIKKEYTKKIIEKIDKVMRASVKESLKYEINKFEKIYGTEWMFIVSNEPETVNALLKILEDGIKKEKCLEMLKETTSEYKKEYYKLISDSIKVSKKNAESYFHVMMEVLRINKNVNYSSEEIKKPKGFFSKPIDQKIEFLSSVVERLNRIKHLESLSIDKSISASERDVLQNFYIEQKKSLSEFLISSRKDGSYVDTQDENLYETNSNESINHIDLGYDKSFFYNTLHKKTTSTEKEDPDNKATENFLWWVMQIFKKNFKVLSQPFHELAVGLKKLYRSPASKGEKIFRIGFVLFVFIGLFTTLIDFSFFSPTESIFYQDQLLKIPVVLAFYWASAKVSSEIFNWTGALYRAYERYAYGIEGHVEYILSEKAKAYFREIELEEMRNYFVKEISASQRRLRKIKDKESEAFNVELNVMKQLGIAWQIIQSGGIAKDRIKTVKAVQLCLREIYKIRSNAYKNQFWQYDDGNTYNLLGVFMQNVRHAETSEVTQTNKDLKSKPQE
jgi:hypothetical protein